MSGYDKLGKCRFAVDVAVLDVWEPRSEPQFTRYQLSDCEERIIEPMLPNKSRGVPRVDDRHIVNGRLFGLAIRCAASRSAGELRTSYDLLRPLPAMATGCVWDKIMDAMIATHDAAVRAC